MKKSALLSLVFLLAFVSVSSAFWGKGDGEGKHRKHEKQEMMDKSPEERHKCLMDRLEEDLGLSESQKAEVDKIIKSGWEKMEAEKEAFHKKMKEFKDAKDAEIMKILNDTQKIKFQEKIKEGEEKMKDRMGKKGKGKGKGECPKMD